MAAARPVVAAAARPVARPALAARVSVPVAAVAVAVPLSDAQRVRRESIGPRLGRDLTPI